MLKIANFEIAINQLIRQIFMFYELGKVPICKFDPNSQYWSNAPIIGRNNQFFGVKWPKCGVPTTEKISFG